MRGQRFTLIFLASLTAWAQGTQVTAIRDGRLFDSNSGTNLIADVIAVAGDPLSDITEMQRVKFVMRYGNGFEVIP